MQMASGPETILASGIRDSGTGNSSVIQTTSAKSIRVYADVTREQGTATLDLALQSSPDKAQWYELETFTQITGNGNYTKAVANPGLFFRVVWIVAGTNVPQFYFDLKVVRFEGA